MNPLKVVWLCLRNFLRMVRKEFEKAKLEGVRTGSEEGERLIPEIRVFKMKGEKLMKYEQFYAEIAKREGGEKQVDIAQIAEIVKIIGQLLDPVGIVLSKVIYNLPNPMSEDHD